jgi:hypothetical protein
MKSGKKTTQRGAPARRTYKTKETFLRWLHKQDQRKKQTAVPEQKKPAPPPSEELMNWADDGGSVKQDE